MKHERHDMWFVLLSNAWKVRAELLLCLYWSGKWWLPFFLCLMTLLIWPRHAEYWVNVQYRCQIRPSAIRARRSRLAIRDLWYVLDRRAACRLRFYISHWRRLNWGYGMAPHQVCSYPCLRQRSHHLHPISPLARTKTWAVPLHLWIQWLGAQSLTFWKIYRWWRYEGQLRG